MLGRCGQVYLWVAPRRSWLPSTMPLSNPMSCSFGLGFFFFLFSLPVDFGWIRFGFSGDVCNVSGCLSDIGGFVSTLGDKKGRI